MGSQWSDTMSGFKYKKKGGHVLASQAGGQLWQIDQGHPQAQTAQVDLASSKAICPYG